MIGNPKKDQWVTIIQFWKFDKKLAYNELLAINGLNNVIFFSCHIIMFHLNIEYVICKTM